MPKAGPTAIAVAVEEALEIYKRLPRMNCGACGERTCLAFAVRVRAGERNIRECAPVFEGEYGHLREALREIVQAASVDG